MLEEIRQNRVALVTGGGKGGLGSAITERLVVEGIDCMIVGRTPSKLKATQERLRAHSAQLSYAAVDITDPEGRDEAVDLCLDRFGRIDILVNNAGYAGAKPLFEFDIETWREQLTINLEAAVFLALRVTADMRKRSWGRVINVASIYGTLALNPYFYEDTIGVDPDRPSGPDRGLAYAASKGGLIQAGRELAAAVGPYGITVNTVSPGVNQTETNRISAMRAERTKQMTPLRRLGRPDDVAHAVAFLASDGADFITGIDLLVDGGWSIW